MKKQHSSSALSRVQKLYPGVTTVRDATKDINIVVEKRDANSKAVKNRRECALAQATKRILGCDGAIINVTTAYIIKGDTATRYKLPESVSREIVSFDREAGFDVGEYHLHAPEPTSRLGAYARSGGRKFNKGAGKPIRPVHFTSGVRRVGDDL